MTDKWAFFSFGKKKDHYPKVGPYNDSATWPLPCHAISLARLVNATENNTGKVICPECQAEYPVTILGQEYDQMQPSDKKPYSKSLENTEGAAALGSSHQIGWNNRPNEQFEQMHSTHLKDQRDYSHSRYANESLASGKDNYKRDPPKGRISEQNDGNHEKKGSYNTPEDRQNTLHTNVGQREESGNSRESNWSSQDQHHFGYGRGKVNDKHESYDSRESNWSSQGQHHFGYGRGKVNDKHESYGISLDRKENLYSGGPLYCSDCKTWIQPKGGITHTGHNVLTKSYYLDMRRDHNINYKEITHERLNKNLQLMEESAAILHVAQNLMTTLDATFEGFSNQIDDLVPNTHGLLKDLNEFSPKGYSNALELAHDTDRMSQLDSKVSDLYEACDKVPQWVLKLWVKSTLVMFLHSFENKQETVFISSGDGKSFSSIKLEVDRIKFNCFTKNRPPRDARVLPYVLFKSFLEDKGVKVFMELSQKDDHLGTVIIRQLTESFWSKQFTFMCSGALGRSYLKIPFHRIAWKDSSGHHLWGGDYSKRNGSGGERVLKEDSTSKQLTPHSIVPGLIASRFGVDDFSTIFRIYLRESKDDYDDHSFAMVEDGLQTLQFIGDMKNITEVSISQVGLILSITN